MAAEFKLHPNLLSNFLIITLFMRLCNPATLPYKCDLGMASQGTAERAALEMHFAQPPRVCLTEFSNSLASAAVSCKQAPFFCGLDIRPENLAGWTPQATADKVCTIYARDEDTCKALVEDLFASDLDECRDDRPEGCQICTNLIGGYSCVCTSGYGITPESNGVCVNIDECSLPGEPICGSPSEAAMN